jgi:hypothetical protein
MDTPQTTVDTWAHYFATAGVIGSFYVSEMLFAFTYVEFNASIIFVYDSLVFSEEMDTYFIFAGFAIDITDTDVTMRYNTFKTHISVQSIVENTDVLQLTSINLNFRFNIAGLVGFLLDGYMIIENQVIDTVFSLNGPLHLIPLPDYESYLDMSGGFGVLIGAYIMMEHVLIHVDIVQLQDTLAPLDIEINVYGLAYYVEDNSYFSLMVTQSVIILSTGVTRFADRITATGITDGFFSFFITQSYVYIDQVDALEGLFPRFGQSYTVITDEQVLTNTLSNVFAGKPFWYFQNGFYVAGPQQSVGNP